MRKTNLSKVTIYIVIIAMLALISISGTYAKYTSKIDVGSDTAVVAKWNVSAEAVEGEFDIFAVSKIYDTKDAVFTADGVKDTDVKTGTDNGIIAPGTWGKFSYVIKNDSDVNATYSVGYTLNNAGVPLQWSIDGADWKDSLADVPATAINMGEEKTVTLYWKWDFAGNDTTDTGLGTAETLATPTIAISAVFTQVD